MMFICADYFQPSKRRMTEEQGKAGWAEKWGHGTSYSSDFAYRLLNALPIPQKTLMRKKLGQMRSFEKVFIATYILSNDFRRFMLRISSG